MNISRISINNHFNANIVGKLKEEVKEKINFIDKQSYEKKQDFYQKIDQIRSLLPNATVDIDKDNPSMYYIKVPGFDIYARREQDKETYDYAGLRKALNNLKENGVSDK